MIKFIPIFLYSFVLFSASSAPLPDNTHKALINKTDIGLINPERVLSALKKQNKLSIHATKAEQRDALNAFTKKAQSYKYSLPKKLTAKLLSNQALSKLQTHHKHRSQAQLSNSIVQNPLVTKSSSLTVQQSPTQTRQLTTSEAAIEATTVKVFAVLIDFPDLPFDNHGLTSSDTDMLYSSYTSEHYNGLLFSNDGFSGPAGQRLMSAYQFYQQESGQSFELTGNVFNWVTADENARYYGENSVAETDVWVRQLVVEAVTKAVARDNINLDDYDRTDLFDIDGDGITNEPDGIIDHVMIFHSSIGEETGGDSIPVSDRSGLSSEKYLGEDAIWSHRFFVFDDNDQPINIQGTSHKVYNYTILPIDAAMGIVAHEFGHDIGLWDEYDLTGWDISAPVTNWSVMASGAWTSTSFNPAGSSPSSFSPLAKDYFQTRFTGNWLNQLEIDYSTALNQSINLVPYTNKTDGINQIKVNLPPKKVSFGTPISGNYQFFSGDDNASTTRLSFTTTLPASPATLTFKARWEIEEGYDYVQINVNNSPIVFYSGNSLDENNAYSDAGWVNLSFNLAAHANSNVTIAIEYVTDEYITGYGFVADDIAITSIDGAVIYEHGAETSDNITLDGFKRIDDTIDGKAHNYYLHLRDLSATNNALKSNLSYDDGEPINLPYEPGILIWYRNQTYTDNNVGEHPGEGFIGVVDADQEAITSRFSLCTYISPICNTDAQLRDATFSLYNQSSYLGDSHLNNNARFNDSNDYSASYHRESGLVLPNQRESGLVLPKLGFSAEVIAQSTNNDRATVHLQGSSPLYLGATQSGLSVTFTIVDASTTDMNNIAWDMGDNKTIDSNENTSQITYQYDTAGEYTARVTYDSESGTKTIETTVIVSPTITGNMNLEADNLTLSYSARLLNTLGAISYQWNFGESGSLSSEGSGQYTYAASGEYQVSLTVRDDTNQAKTFTQIVTVVDDGENDVNSPTKKSSGGTTHLITLLMLGFYAVRRTRMVHKSYREI